MAVGRDKERVFRLTPESIAELVEPGEWVTRRDLMHRSGKSKAWVTRNLELAVVAGLLVREWAEINDILSGWYYARPE